jgi:periplasmic copper chaperone A
MKVIRYATQHMTRGAVQGLFLAGALMAGGAANAAAGNALAVSHCWIRALPGNLPSGGYFVATNTGDQPVDLVGVETPAFGMAMLHQSQTQGGTSRMVMVDKVRVPAHGTLAFTPGDYHLMLEQPKQPLQIGAKLPLTFVFGGGQKISAMCVVKGAAAAAE